MTTSHLAEVPLLYQDQARAFAWKWNRDPSGPTRSSTTRVTRCCRCSQRTAKRSTRCWTTWKTVTWTEVKIRGKGGPGPSPATGRNDDEFKKSLRDQYLEGWAFAALWVDSAPVTAFSIMESWRENYNKGNRNGKRRRAKTMPQAKIADMLLYTAAD